MTLLRKLLGDDRGATAVEYGLLCALIVVAALGAFSFFGARAVSMYTGIATNVSTVL